MSRLFETSRRIDAPPDRVWDVMVDVARWPEWTPTVDSVEVDDGAPLHLGSTAQVRQPRLPRARWTVTELEDGRRFTWEARGPGLRTVGRHEVVPAGSGSEVTLSIEQQGPMSAVAASVWRGLTQRYIEQEAASLDRRVTGPGA